MYNDKNHNQSKICFFYKNTGIEKIYTLEDYSRLISIFIEQKVDLSLIPSLYERSPELFGLAIRLTDYYDTNDAQSVLNLAKMMNIAYKNKDVLTLHATNALIETKTSIKEFLEVVMHTN